MNLESLSISFGRLPNRLRDWSVVLAFAVGAVATAGCASAPKRPVETEATLLARDHADLQDMAADFGEAVGGLLQRATERTAASPDGQTTIHVLAMSGGGDFGAFGAGLLVGWGQSEDPAYRRPDFDAVTGVSTGALLAPFAYVGTDEACLEVETFYRNPKKDWVHSRGMFFFLPKNPSFMTIPGLQRDLYAAFDAAFVEQMAAQSRKGKLLVVSATDLDFGRQRFWSVGKEAEDAVASGDLDRVHRMLLASAAIPAVFPPIMIDDSLYADGGVSANVFLRLEAQSPNGFVQRWLKDHPGKPLPRVRYWVIVNNQLRHVPKTTQPRWPAVAGPSLDTAIRSATLAEVRWLAAEIRYVNEKFDADIELRVTGIPDDWRPPVPGDFKRETMDSLAELGRKMGADPSSWQVWAAPETDSSPR